MPGKNSSAETKAARKQSRSMIKQNNALADLKKFATPVPGTTPEMLFENLLDQVNGQLSQVNTAVSNIPAEEMWRDTIAGRQPNEWILLQRDLMDRAFRFAHSALGMNLKRRQVEVEEAQAAMVAFLLREALTRANLPKRQMDAVMVAVREVAQEQAALPEVVEA